MAEWVSFAEVKSRVSLEEVLHSYAVDWLRHSGPHQYRGRCPIHEGEGSEAFHVNQERNVFHCFACGAGGNVLDFVAAMEQCSVREAAVRLQARYGVHSGASHVGARRVAAKEERKLVTKKREVNPPLSFALSVNPKHPYLAQRGIEYVTARYFGVGYYAGPGLMAGRLAIPIQDERGRLIAYCGRALAGATPRYSFPAGFQKSCVLFNYHRALKSGSAVDPLIVVEGFFDCMRVHQAGYPRVAALMGCTLAEPQAELLAHSFPQVWLFLDGDAAGRAASIRVAATLRNKCTVRLLDPGPGSQPDQLSADEICRLLESPERRSPIIAN